MPSSLLPDSLPLAHKLAAGTYWQLMDDSWVSAAESATEKILHPQLIEASRLLKMGTRRLIFSVPGPSPREIDAVVKAFPLNGLRQRLKHKKYAPSEALNLDNARRKGLPVPTLFGVGSQRHLGLVTWNAVLMEYIQGQTLGEAIRCAVREAGLGDLQIRVTHLFSLLFHSGCNHIDLRPDALIMGSTKSDDRIIDFQYCRFLSDPSAVTIGAQAGYFAHWLQKSMPDSAFLNGWPERLFDTLDLRAAERSVAQRAFDENALEPRSIAERLQQ